MAALLACPFCRQLYPAGEATDCPDCGVALVEMHRLPPSLDARAEEMAELERVAPDDRVLPWRDFGRGRGVLLATAALGLVAFCLPWIHMSRPEDIAISGVDLARGRAGWLWGGAVGWFLTIPLVLTRRTPNRMRGVRIILATFAAMTVGEVAMLLSLPPTSRGYAVEYSWAFGIFLSGALGLVGIAAAVRFGGRPHPGVPAPPPRAPERGSGRVLH
jgi:hypothetical protein